MNNKIQLTESCFTTQNLFSEQITPFNNLQRNPIIQKKKECFEINIPVDEGAIEKPSLSKKELIILSMVASGRTLVQIADSLRIKPSTINWIRLRILEKLNLKSNKELANYAFMNNNFSKYH